MRIITGIYKGRKLETPIGRDVRPTGDKVKEAIFSILMAEVPGAVCVDLFAGTGNLGLEALSRGADFCHFCDNDRTSIGIIKRNIAHCGAEEKARVHACDYMNFLRKMAEPADIFFLDPPYHAGLYEKCLETIDTLDLLSEQGIIVAEHEKGTDLPQDIGRLFAVSVHRYGKTCVTLFAHREET